VWERVDTTNITFFSILVKWQNYIKRIHFIKCLRTYIYWILFAIYCLMLRLATHNRWRRRLSATATLSILVADASRKQQAEMLCLLYSSFQFPSASAPPPRDPSAFTCDRAKQIWFSTRGRGRWAVCGALDMCR